MKRRFNRRPLPSPQALDMMSRALKDLQKTIATSGSRDVPEVALEDVRKACLEVENSLAARGLLRNTRRLRRLFAGLEHYGRSIDVLCNGTQYLSWIWSPITVVLRMASDCVKAFEVIMKAYTKVGDTLCRFQLLQNTFSEDHRFQELLAVFYSDILRFHGFAYKFAQRSNWEVFLLTTCGRFERRFGNIIENLERHAELIDKEGNVLNISETQATLRKLLSQQQENLKQIEAEEKRDSTRQYFDILSRLQIDERDQVAIFDTLSESLRFGGTCGWALQHEDISSWLDSKGRVQSLWLHGSAGTGKSVLSAHLIAFMKSTGSSRAIYHFCSDQYVESTKYDQILRSIIRQLLQVSDEATAHAHTTLLKDRKVPSLSELERLVEELLVIILDESPEAGTPWVVVDGVDECEPDKLPQLELGIGTNELEEIKDDVVRKADGMFLYARLILDYLGSQLPRNKDHLRAKLSRLPKTLQEFYSKLLGQIISHRDDDSREIVKSIFRWVAFAKRPLRQLEFLSAVTFSDGNPDVCALVPKFILEECGNLIEVRHDKTICFIHGSVKEFLTTSDTGFAITEEEATEEQAIASVACLVSASRCFHHSGDAHERRVRVVKGLYGLVIYSSEHWVEYTLSMTAQNDSKRCRYFDIVKILMTELERLGWGADIDLHCFEPGVDACDPRLDLLHEHPLLQRLLQYTMTRRSHAGLEESIVNRGSIDEVPTRKKSPDMISRILEAYQETIRWLLREDDYPGVLAEDLESFKAQFHSSTFTCRLRSCPRATIGFESEKLLKEHEWAHSAGPRCSFPRCQYPPFANSQALKRHVEKHHTPAQTMDYSNPMTTSNVLDDFDPDPDPFLREEENDSGPDLFQSISVGTPPQ
ncbi:hypothetical protein SAPIO_CDS1375 [Scedosporium apiospermum]|uniref:Uncharacterized protein n=1 Tax=Pseudallescheria apiosperma TaxID=563466 RepID=A0A084GF66_PSEDA|nr:uncharacterized protein SAPIO_CDS1375 [Scedosporium apiospermum]KEZ45978.1 hypothetical protein SAPIO_CDS1375 [Scedosporium apiospermum]